MDMCRSWNQSWVHLGDIWDRESEATDYEEFSGGLSSSLCWSMMSLVLRLHMLLDEF